MPSWSIHLGLANKLKNRLNLNDEFIIGNVLPDALIGYIIDNPSQIIDKSINHFQDGKPPIINIDNFIKKYKKKLNKPIVKGYLAHLMTDKFYNEYTYKNHYSFEGGRPKSILKDGSKLPALIEKPWQIKQNDFELYGQKLINNNRISQIEENIKDFDIINECPINKEDLIKIKNKINEISNKKGKFDNSKFRMFTEEELDKVYDKCFEKIYSVLKEM